MYFIERLNIKNSLINIVKIIILIYLIILVAIQIGSMKKSLDQLYSSSLLSISELNKANKIYHMNIQNNIYQSINLTITPTQAILDMKKSLPIVKKIWQDYHNNFQHNDKMEYLDYAMLEIDSINNYFEEITVWCTEIKQMQMLSLREVDEKIDNVNIIIQELINYELQIAQEERECVVEKFQNFIYQIIFFLFITTLVIIRYIYFINNKQQLLKEELKKLTSNCQILETLEYNDSLTSLYNRRYFKQIYKEKLKEAKVNNSVIALIMIDIDCFSEYNNLYGYAKGDELLIRLADILKDIISSDDYLFRFNGEAFVILLTQTDETKSIAFTQKISQIIKDKKIEHKGSKIDTILTVSVGMAYLKTDDTTTEYSLISQADKMLSSAKESGRDTTQISKGKDKNETKKLING